MTGGPVMGQGTSEGDGGRLSRLAPQAASAGQANASSKVDAPHPSQPPAIDLTNDSELEHSSDADVAAPPTSAPAQSMTAEGKKTFSLFDKGSWGAAPPPEASTSANAPAAAAKRPRRAAAAKADTARQAGVAAFLAATELPDDADAFQIMGASMKSAAATASKPKKAGASKKAGPSRQASPEKKSPPRPVPPPAPPKPISLKVKGTMPAQDPSQVHSFFAARPRKRDEDGEGGPAASASAAISQPRPIASLFGAPRAPRKPQLEPEWPSPDSIHVQPSGEPASTRASYLHHIGPFDRKGKGKALEPLGDEAGVAARVHPAASSEPAMAIETTTSLPHAASSLQPSLSDLRPSSASDPPGLTSLRGKVAPAIERAYHAAHATAAAQQKSSLPPDDGQMWTERFRPQAAEEVLGNEEPAAYLRDWLRELQIRPTAAKSVMQGFANGSSSGASTPTTSQPLVRKRRIVQTRVDRIRAGRATKRRRGGREGFGPGSTDDEGDSMANFIVDDDEEQEAWLQQFYPPSEQQTQESEDDLMMLQPPSSIPSHLAGSPALTTMELPPIDTALPHAAGTLRFDPDGRLTNCIVLVGPVGAGKTSAAYACASELGFEVFELFPGMRKRAGKDLASAVGELGRNHMVGAGGSAGGAAGAQRGGAAGGSLLKKMMEIGKEAAGDQLEDAPSPSASTTASMNGNGGVPVTRQSLILIEEVDVTFEDDKGFWAGIVDLVAESKRPVVLTCNDISQVPVETLPLQTVLYFEAAAPELAVPYLQLCAAAAGTACPTEAVRGLYLSTRTSADCPVDLFSFEGLQDGPTSPSRSLVAPEKATSVPNPQATRALDLRHAMTQLQFLAQHAKGRVGQEPVPQSAEVTHAQEAAQDGSTLVKGGSSRDSELQQLRHLAHRLDLASSAYGSAMTLSLPMASEAYEPDPASDMVWQGCDALPSSSLSHRACPAAMLERHAAIQEALSAAAVHCSDADRILAFERLEQAQHIWTLLSSLRISLHARLPRLESVTDYAPYVRSMVSFDEAERATHDRMVAAALAEQQSKGEGSRMTRNSIRHLVGSGGRGVEFEGWLDLDALEVEAARRTGFDEQGYT